MYDQDPDFDYTCCGLELIYIGVQPVDSGSYDVYKCTSCNPYTMSLMRKMNEY